jgi:hypothetical protein
LKNERLSSNTELTFYKTLTRSKTTYACSAWEFAADSHLLKLRHLQNRVFRTIGNLPRWTPTRALHLAFQIPYVYDYVTKIYSKQAEVIQNHDNVNVRIIGNNEAQHRKYKGSKLMAVTHTIVQVSKLPQKQ